jgi:hypothetical protein
MEDTIAHLREEYQEYPDDIVSRLLDVAEDVGRTASALMIEAAKCIDDIRNGRGG